MEHFVSHELWGRGHRGGGGPQRLSGGDAGYGGCSSGGGSAGYAAARTAQGVTVDGLCPA